MKNVEKVTVKKKISVVDTLLAIPVGKSVAIKFTTMKPHTVRGMAYRLNGKGYNFTVSEKGCPDYLEVTRNK
ncbi:MAG: hypothetical protein LBQ73_06730 [Tannerellaceae bacterium]|jgi:hypothetical protein|nr:hypothetical protein [Tannerellaceae bacterium]